MGNKLSAQERLGRACVKGDVGAARKAVNSGADATGAAFNVDGTTGTGVCCYTAAWVAARHGQCAVLDVLLSAPISADPDKGNVLTGDTPSYIACTFGHFDAVAVLLAHGADPNHTNRASGWTLCMIAASRGNTTCLRALKEGAARQGRTLDVNAVIAGGVDEGKTALDVALKYSKAARGNTEAVAAYLRDELGALRAADLPPPSPQKKRPKSATKKPAPAAGRSNAGGGEPFLPERGESTMERRYPRLVFG